MIWDWNLGPLVQWVTTLALLLDHGFSYPFTFRRISRSTTYFNLAKRFLKTLDLVSQTQKAALGGKKNELDFGSISKIKKQITDKLPRLQDF